jgi:hypothetical protein
MQPDQTVAVEWIVEESAASDYVQAIEQNGGEITQSPEAWVIPPELLDEYPDPQFEPFMMIGAVVAVGFLIKRVADVYTDLTHPGGQIVDCREGGLAVRVAPQLKPGTLVIVSDEGPKVFQTNEQDEALTLLGQLVTADHA